MNETQALYREVFRTANEQTLLVDGTSPRRHRGRARVADRAGRPGARARLRPLRAPAARDRRALRRRGARHRGAVGPGLHARGDRGGDRARCGRSCSRSCTATPPRPWPSRSTSSARICAKHGVLFYTDVTASLAGNAFDTDAWGLDAVTAGLQKCLGGPSGSAPVTFSPSAVDVIDARKSDRGGHPRARATRSARTRSARTTSTSR